MYTFRYYQKYMVDVQWCIPIFFRKLTTKCNLGATLGWTQWSVNLTSSFSSFKSLIFLFLEHLKTVVYLTSVDSGEAWYNQIKNIIGIFKIASWRRWIERLSIIWQIAYVNFRPLSKCLRIAIYRCWFNGTLKMTY